MKEEFFWILLSKKLTGEASLEELAQLQSLLDSNTNWALTSENLQELWSSEPVAENRTCQAVKDAYLSHIGRLKSVHPDFDVQLEDELVEHEMEVDLIELDKERDTNLFTKFKSRLSYSLIILLIAFLGIKSFEYFSLHSSKPANKSLNELTVNPGSKSRITLPDGTRVWINSATKLDYASNFNETKREVFLNGEAYFEVARNPQKPFVVHTSGIDIKVLGTAFNVKAFEVESTIETTLIHGSIEVTKTDDPNGAKVLLKPHEKLVYKKMYEKDFSTAKRSSIEADKLKALSLKSFISINPVKPNLPDSAIIETAWMKNKLVFEEERFADLALKMERWYNIKININDNKLSNYRVSGSFVDETAEEAFDELKILIPFNYKIKNKEFIIMK